MWGQADLQKLVQMLAYLGIIGPGSYPAHSVVLGAGANAAPGSAGLILGSNGPAADPSFQSASALGLLSLPLPANSVGSTQISAGAVGAAQLGANVVGDGQLAWGNVLGRECDSVAAVEALNVSIYTRAFTTGYSAAGDLGNAAYYYNPASSATVDGGQVLSAAGGVGRWLMLAPERITANQYGAQGNNSTDASVALGLIFSIGFRGFQIPAGQYLFATGIVNNYNTGGFPIPGAPSARADSGRELGQYDPELFGHWLCDITHWQQYIRRRSGPTQSRHLFEIHASEQRL
jgi:hypothetical protein